MELKPKDTTIFNLFNSHNEQLVIPSYQRRYAWKLPQVWALFEDIDMLQEKEGHLFGMLIFHSTMHHGDLNQIEVVDGQQRVTTVSLLLIALKKVFADIGMKSKSIELENMLYCIDEIEENRVPKLKLGELDNKDYLRILDGKTTGINNKNMLGAYVYFCDWIEERVEKNEKKWIIRFFNKLVRTARIIRLDVGMAQDAYKLFETINNRGLKLSATDVLKNFILGHAAKIGKTKLRKVKDLWSELITALDDINTDDFFRQYISGVYRRKITKSKLIEEFKKHYLKSVKNADLLGEYTYYSDRYDIPDGENPEDVPEDKNLRVKKRVDVCDYIQNILNAGKCYAKIINKKFSNKTLNQKLVNLDYIQCRPSLIFLMFYLQKRLDFKEKFVVLDLIGTLMLRRHICAQRTSENDDIFAKLLKIAPNKSFLVNLKKSIKEYYPENEEFLDRFPTQSFETRLTDRAKYILAEIEYYNTGNTGELSINLGKDVHLEHIIPQKISASTQKKKFGDWEVYLGKRLLKTKHKKYVSRIGNMTLLSGELNIIASNNPFLMKTDCYKKSNIKITQSLSKKYKDFKFKQVESRGEELAKIALKIWKI